MMVVLALLVPALPEAQAQSAEGSATRIARPPPPRDSQSCRRQCNAGLTPRQQLPREAQACLVRCEAALGYLQRQNSTGTAEASGRGRATTAAASGSAATLGAAGAVPAGAGGRTLVAYAGAPPGRGFAIGDAADRLVAHRAAETGCFSANGAACRPLTETRDRCLAIVQGVRATGLAITPDPRTYSVHIYTHGSGPTQRAAEFAALSDCATRMLTEISCRVVAQRCG
jgi:hypothetical protein